MTLIIERYIVVDKKSKGDITMANGKAGRPISGNMKIHPTVKIELADDLKKLAEREHRSFSNMCEFILYQYVQEHLKD